MEYIRQAFDAIAAQYDSQRVHVIPDIQNFYGSAVWAAECPKKNPSILDIGAGTGLLSAMILEKFPRSDLTLLDISEKMLAVARERFREKKNVHYRTGDYSTIDLGGSYDIICSALSIHHLESPDKRKLFDRIYRALPPGGVFINADQVQGETPYFSQNFLEYWDSFLRNGVLRQEEIAEIQKRRDTLDKNEKLSVQLRWLAESGFSDVDTIYKNRTFIVTVARKQL